MFRYRAENENLRAHIATLRAVAGGLFLANLALWHAVEHAKKEVRLYIPPDIRTGAVIRPDDPRPEHIYTFARYIFQNVNYWPRDGERDYGQAIFRLAPYLTPACQDELRADLEGRGKKGELTGRARWISDLPGSAYDEGRVAVLGPGVWKVVWDARVEEYVHGARVKTVELRYPLKVVRYDVSPEANPFGLALDCFASPIERLSEETIEKPAEKGLGIPRILPLPDLIQKPKTKD